MSNSPTPVYPHPYRSSAASAWYASAAVLVASSAALTLAACGPRDETALSRAPAVVNSASNDTPRTSGQPVPVADGHTFAVGPAPDSVVASATRTAPDTGNSDAPANDSAATSLRPLEPAPTPMPPPKPVANGRIGEITSIEPIRTRPQGTGVGAAVGGVLGAVVGNRFGHGLGRAALTGAGAVGGALAGNNVERNHKEGVSGYRIVVRLQNGRTRVFDRREIGDLHVGDRVRLDADSFHRA